MGNGAGFAKVSLVLSREFRPLFFQDYKKAFINYYLGKVDVIEFYPIQDLSIKTVNKEYKVPVIIKSNIPYKHFVSEAPTKIAIFLRDNYTCAYCGKRCSDDEITIDHIIPSSKGGTWSWTNLVTSCVECNRKKKDNIWKPVYAKPKAIEHFWIQYLKYKDRLHPIIKKFLISYFGKSQIKQF